MSRGNIGGGSPFGSSTTGGIPPPWANFSAAAALGGCNPHAAAAVGGGTPPAQAKPAAATLYFWELLRFAWYPSRPRVHELR